MANLECQSCKVDMAYIRIDRGDVREYYYECPVCGKRNDLYPFRRQQVYVISNKFTHEVIGVFSTPEQCKRNMLNLFEKHKDPCFCLDNVAAFPFITVEIKLDKDCYGSN